MTPQERKERIQRALQREQTGGNDGPPPPPTEYTQAAHAAGIDVATHLKLTAKVTKRSVRSGMNAKDKQGRITLEFSNKSNVTGELVFNFLNQEAIRTLPTQGDFIITIGLPDNTTV